MNTERLSTLAVVEFDDGQYPSIEYSPMDASMTPPSSHSVALQDQLAQSSHSETNYQPSPCVGAMESFPQAPHGLGLFIDTHNTGPPAFHPLTPISADPWSTNDQTAELDQQQRMDFYFQVSEPSATWGTAPIVAHRQLSGGDFTPPSSHRMSRSHRSSISSSCSGTDSGLPGSRQSPLVTPLKTEAVDSWQLSVPPCPSTLQGRDFGAALPSPRFFSHSTLDSIHKTSYLNQPAGQAIQPRPSHEDASFHGQERGWSELCDAQQIKAEALRAVARTRQKRKHTTIEEAKFTCADCGKFFKRKHNYTSHLKTTHNHETMGSRPFPCSGCDRAFKRKADLERHKTNVHIKSLDHKCIICFTGFARRDTLRRHIEQRGCKTLNELEKKQTHSLSPISGTPMF